MIDFGTGGLDYSVNQEGNTGFVYSRPFAKPAMFFADLKRPSDCVGIVDPRTLNNVPGYAGPANICDFRDAWSHVFQDTNVARPTSPSLVFGDRASGCYTGLLLFRQDALYGAIDPLDVGADGSLTFDWWYDDSGNSDFGALCVDDLHRTVFLPRLRR